MKARTQTKPSTTPGRGRPRKVESYVDWMERLDASVDSMARKMERRPPSYAYLHPAQRRIVQMLIDHMRSLPEITAGENIWDKAAKEYTPVNRILVQLFSAKYPEWRLTPRHSDGFLDVDKLPHGEGEVYTWMLRNCAGRAPIETAAACSDDDYD